MDTVANLLTTLINAQRVQKKRVAVPYSVFNKNLLDLLQQKGLIRKVRLQESPKEKLIVTLAYEEDGSPLINGVKRLSKPGGRVYAGYNEIPFTYQGYGFIILSTSKGLLHEAEARKQKMGGELICAIW